MVDGWGIFCDIALRWMLLDHADCKSVKIGFGKCHYMASQWVKLGSFALLGTCASQKNCGHLKDIIQPIPFQAMHMIEQMIPPEFLLLPSNL